jgi:hypothetical protein
LKTTQNLPENYQPVGKFDLKSMKMLIFMNVAGLILLILSIWFFGWFVNRIRPNFDTLFYFEFSNLSALIISIAKLIFTIIFVLLLHEGFHAFFFWLFSKQKPIIGFKGAYAYASMPGWYFPRNKYLLIIIAPLVFITLIGTVLLVILPTSILNIVLIALVINTSGAVGDLYLFIWLLTKPPTAYALDQIDTTEFFVPIKDTIQTSSLE